MSLNFRAHGPVRFVRHGLKQVWPFLSAPIQRSSWNCAGLCTQTGATFPLVYLLCGGDARGEGLPPPRNRSQKPISVSEEFTAANMYTGGEGEGFAPKHDATPKHIRFSSGGAGRVGSKLGGGVQ